MLALHHGKGIRCIHMHGWSFDNWCLGCRNHWHATRDEGISQEEYEQESDQALAHAALVGLSRGEIAIGPPLDEFDLSMTFEERALPH